MIRINLLEVIKQKLPILELTKGYHLDTAISDLVAGITVGLTLIPQVIAYASLAGLNPQYGLYSSLCGGIIYAVFGTIPELNIAPTALLSLLTFSYTHEIGYDPVAAAVLLTFLSGIIELLCGILHLGFLVDFVSTPVVAGFTSAGAITIASSQMKNLLGLHFNAENFISVWSNIIRHIGEIQQWDAILGVSCCVVLLVMRKLKDFGSPPLEEGKEGIDEKKKVSFFRKFIWFCSVARNAFVVVGCAIAAYVLDDYNRRPFSLTSSVPAGLPSVDIPVRSANTSNGTLVPPLEMIRDLGSGIFVVPFIAILGNVAIAKAFAHGKVVDATQEMIAVGVCNVIGSFFGSFPVNASFSRSAVSNASGVKTPLAGVYSATMVILALTFLTPYFPYIPKATLSAVIICAVIFMVEITLTRVIWGIHRIDLIPFFATVIACLLLGIDVGILVGMGVDVLFLLYSTARPSILLENITNDRGCDYVKVTPTSSILFPSAEFMREKIMKHSVKYGAHYKFVVIDCQRISRLDFTAGKCIAAFVTDLKKIKRSVVFFKPKKSVLRLLKSVTNDTANVAEKESELNAFLRENAAASRAAAILSTISEQALRPKRPPAKTAEGNTKL